MSLASCSMLSRPRLGAKLYWLALALLLGGAALTALNIHQLRDMQQRQQQQLALAQAPQAPQPGPAKEPRAPVVWVYAKRIESGYLNHILNVFKRMGYERGGPDSEPDIIWSHDYPFTSLASHVSNLKPHQRLNHWPGIGWITNKVHMATSDLKFIPKAFKLPEERVEFLKVHKKDPTKLWVMKNSNHRGIKVKPVDELNLNTKNTFIQEYVANPFLIDDRKFDLGVYTVIASIDPLRIYIYGEETLVRFCSKDYHPIDFSEVNKYVVTDDYTPTWKIPSLKDTYSKMQYSHKQTLIHYLKQQGKDPDQMYLDIEDAIREVMVSKEHKFISAARKYLTPRNFFEMVRFDFVVDEDLNVYLMEVNMSPNLSSLHTPPNKVMYEQVLFNYLNLVGVTSPVHHSSRYDTAEETVMQVSDRDIQVFADLCLSDRCAACESKECRLCRPCLSTENREILVKAFLEHVNRRNMKRLLPPPMTQEEAQSIKESYLASAQQPHESDGRLSEANQLMQWWFAGKCLQDQRWCV